MASATESYEKILTANLQRANDFLRFAEAKNAALIALGSGWFVATLNLECGGKPIPRPFTACVPIAMSFALCAAVVSLISFLPRLRLDSFRGGKRAGPHPKNLLYFGDIASLPIRTLESEMRSRYVADQADPSPAYIHDLAEQISVNSDIAVRKMRLFSLGAIAMFVAVFVFLIPALVLAARGVKTLW